MRRLLILLACVLAAAPVLAQTESVVEIESRGQKIRALLTKPANPVGSVILIAGGHGILSISPQGMIGWGRGNQLVRTRALYAAAGFATLVPDAAPDMGTPKNPRDGYRFSAPHGQDIGALVRYMRGIKTPVALVATSRGALTVGVALANTAGPARPDAVVMTAPMLMPVGNQPSFHRAIGGDPGRARLPLLIVGHKKDACQYTNASVIERFKSWHGQAQVIVLDGPAGSGDPCEALSAHGFFGIDGQIVSTVTGWIRSRN